MKTIRLRSICSFATMAVMGICLLTAAVAAETNSPPKQSGGSRYLLVYENSRAMERMAKGAVRSVESIINSGMNGQFRRSDTLGIWTFNDDLKAGQFPLQELIPENQKAIVSAITHFLAAQKCEKESHFEKVLPSLQRVSDSSRILTVLLVVSGMEDIHGTPFDEPINATFAKWKDQQQAKRMPFLVLLRSYRGQIKQYAISPAPWPLDVPAILADQSGSVAQQGKPNPSAAATTTPKTQPAPLSALIVSGKKTEPRTQAVPANTAARPASNTTTSVLASAEIVPIGTNLGVYPGGSVTDQTVPPPQTNAAAQVVLADRPGTAPVDFSSTEPRPERRPATPVVAAKISAATASPTSPLVDRSNSLQTAIVKNDVSSHTNSAMASAGRNSEQPDEPRAAVPPKTISFALRTPTLSRLLWYGGAALGVLMLVALFFAVRGQRTRDSRPISLITQSLDR